MKTAQRIREYIGEIPVGEPFATAMFLQFGTRATVDQALSRLVKAGYIARITRGVFVRPEENRYVGKVLPGPYKVVETIAKATGAIIGVHGAEAARRFELTTQVPTRPVFYTSGPSKRFHIGQLKVELKHVSLRKLALAGQPAGLALSALWYIGKQQVNPMTIESIRKKLPPTEYEALKAAASSMPAWMTDAFHRHEQAAANA